MYVWTLPVGQDKLYLTWVRMADPFWNRCAYILVMIFCTMFCRRRSHLVKIFSRDTLNAVKTVKARFLCDESFVCCFIRHPENPAGENQHNGNNRWLHRWNKIKESMRFWWVERFHFLQLYRNNRFLQTPEEGLLTGGYHNKMILWNWPKKTLMLYYVLLQLTCSCHCCWPSSFLPSRVASRRAQGFSNEVNILESIRRVFFQRQVCIWNKCARDHFSAKVLFAL